MMTVSLVLRSVKRDIRTRGSSGPRASGRAFAGGLGWYGEPSAETMRVPETAGSTPRVTW
jgi:hypothetical protein